MMILTSTIIVLYSQAYLSFLQVTICVSSLLLWERFVMIPFDGYPGMAFAFFFRHGVFQPDIPYFRFYYGLSPHLMPQHDPRSQP
jgi:hypothetical protein